VSTTEPALTVGSEKAKGSMDDYYRLKRSLLTITALLSGGIFMFVWLFYSLGIALNYLIGACAGVVFLALLSRNVEKMGVQSTKLGKSHLAVFVGLMIIAARWDQLQILPVFLGFLTYKITLLIYVLQAAFGTNSS
jgi:ATP synthase protein I